MYGAVRDHPGAARSDLALCSRWVFLEAATNASFNVPYAAGRCRWRCVPAPLPQLFYMQWVNTAVGYCGPFRYETQYCRRLRGYLEASLAWIEEQTGSGCDRTYWHQVALETTIRNSDKARWWYLWLQGNVLEWLWNIVANWLAHSGTEDVVPSLRYNSQWMLVDYKVCSPGRTALWQGLLMVLEQVLFSPQSLHSLLSPIYFSLLPGRSNDYLQDPLLQCRCCDPPHNTENVISTHSNLNPANDTNPFAALCQRCPSSSDTKATFFGMVHTFGLLAASRPAWDIVPTFC
ncbi:hypothetical protein ASZ78_014314 [Callipepla squamata]|uniref:Phospholipase B-like n=1 Tax=Callipepla squamata TaxID=9009 RepID=A0A226MND2_CALSU|nr:hypothetical protein ASZ78_014314 [Callipepla squamata]